MADCKQMCEIGFIGLGVMGKNLVLNLADNGYRIAAFDLDNNKTEQLIRQDRQETGQESTRIVPCDSLNAMVARLAAPRLVILSVPAGDAVDNVCHQLIDAGLAPEDILVDTGNSLWTDTVRRAREYQGKLVFFSSAVSGGEQGARFGPSLMPSGDATAWERVAPVWRAIAAKVDSDSGRPLVRQRPGEVISQGDPCTTYIGEAGSGHYVKMVHNGIEYADMQIICEAYHLLRSGLQMDPVEIAEIFAQWAKGPLESYLMDISVDILRHRDPRSGKALVDMILDKAGQKGTGLWTAVSSLELGCPAPTIAQAVYARALSADKTLRKTASEHLPSPETVTLSDAERQQFVTGLHDALYCAKICAYAQGFELMKQAGNVNKWTLNFTKIAKIWRAGCIIRAAFLQPIAQAFAKDPALENLLLDEFFTAEIARCQHNWRRTLASATLMGIPVGALSSSLAYYDSLRSAVLPANLLQAQRDYFGAHGFERVDEAPGQQFHIEY